MALRNRWRRQQLEPELRDEVAPKNIIMIGPTGVGKTEIARRLARLTGSPFLKVEASKFTEVGYVGRDVESIVRDLVEAGIQLVRDERVREVRVRAERAAEDRLLDLLVAASAGVGDSLEERRRGLKRPLRDGMLEGHEVELEVAGAADADPGHVHARRASSPWASISRTCSAACSAARRASGWRSPRRDGSWPPRRRRS